MELIISLLCGALGGNIAGLILKNYSLGRLWNSIIGILGGGIGAQLLGLLSINIDGIIGTIVGSGVGGVVLLILIGAVKIAMKK